MKSRLHGLDEIRGFTLISMILYHLFWDIYYVVGIKMDWYSSTFGYVWQQSICISFILISGFCFCLGKHHVKRSALIFAAGILTTAVTLMFTPESKIIFGILTFVGSAGFIMILINRIHLRLEKILDKGTLNLTMLIGSVLFFIVCYRINYRGLFLFYKMIELPAYMFKGYFATYIGFCDPTFSSADYFSIIPWIFLYMAGYYLYRLMFICFDNKRALEQISQSRFPKIAFLGRHTLIIYLLHQPVLYAVAMAMNYFR